ncbi:MAG: sulfatase-like hydrolase/transferase [Planctomycetota bacterium]
MGDPDPAAVQRANLSFTQLVRAAPDRRWTRLCLRSLAALSLLLALWQTHRLLVDAWLQAGGVGRLYALLAWTSMLLLAVLLAHALIAALVGAIARWWAVPVLGAAGHAFLQFYIMGDMMVYHIYGYHYNAMLFDLAFAAEAGDSLDMGAGTRLSIYLRVSLLILVLAGAAVALAWPARARRARLIAPAEPCGVLMDARLGSGRAWRWLLGLGVLHLLFGLVLALTGVLPLPTLLGLWGVCAAGLSLCQLSIRRAWVPLLLAPALFALALLGARAEPQTMQLLASANPLPALAAWGAAGLGGLRALWWMVLPVLAAEVAIGMARLRPTSDPVCARAPRRSRVWLAGLAVVLAVIVCDKAVYALGAALDDQGVLRVGRVLGSLHPAWPQGAPGGESQLDRLRRDLDGELLYPLEPLRQGTDATQPDIIILCIEGARADCFDPRFMPRTHAFAADAIVATDHRSGGNVTRRALFSLCYGLWAPYWEAALRGGHRPAVIDLCARLDYRFAILSCTDLNWPELRQTCFRGLGNAVHDRWDDAALGGRVGRDRAMTDRAIAAIADDDPRPLFAFLFYDATHFPYLYPPEHAVSGPALPLEQIDVLELARGAPDERLRALRHRYRNAVHYVDAQIGRVLDALRASGRLERSLVIIVGDHGEEFRESGAGPGHLIHNGSYSLQQTGCVCVIRPPGGGGGRGIAHTTAHVDIAPTIAEVMGVITPASSHSQGHSLLAPKRHRWLLYGGWGEAAVQHRDVIMRFGLGSRLLEAYDLPGYHRHPDPHPVYERHRQTLAEVEAALRKFLGMR